MIFRQLPLQDAFVIEHERHEDHRGFFARTFCAREFAELGLNPRIAQCNMSYNRRRGSVRGLHYQAPPAAESKLVRCTRGAIFDVIVDLRPNSRTFGMNTSVELSAENRWSLYVPEMFAHGYQTLTDDVELLYQMSEFYSPEHAQGVRFDDPAFSIEWPLPITNISKQDQSWPLLGTICLAS